MTEAYSDTLQDLMRYYGRIENNEVVEYGAQIPFNFNLIETTLSTGAYEIQRIIKEFIGSLPQGHQIHPNWVVSI